MMQALTRIDLTAGEARVLAQKLLDAADGADQWGVALVECGNFSPSSLRRLSVGAPQGPPGELHFLVLRGD